jgi:ParB family transcriptional regulator, chromosome partitioning protein
MTTAATEYQTVPLTHLVESAANPRRITSKTADAELADSVKKMGVLEPLLVREVLALKPGDLPGRLELIAGHRRLAAARAAGLAEVPVRVLELNEEQALEAAIVENLQRQDVHPLDEAEGFARLIEHHKHAVPDVAARVGKSEAYVYQRLALRRLSPPARKLFVDGLITAAHALQLVKLEPKQQDQVLGSLRPNDEVGYGTAASLGRLIREDFFQDLSSAPWKLGDAALVPAAGPCSTCPKRAGAQPGLFADEKVKGETCLDAVCFDTKMKAHLSAVKAVLKVDAGRKSVLEVSTGHEYPRQKGILYDGQFTRVDKKKPCAFATPAVVVGGKERGQALTVCVDAGCKEHHARSDHGGDESWKKKQAAEAKRNKAESASRLAIFKATIVKAPTRLALEDLRLVARRFVYEMQHDSRQRLCEALGLEPLVTKQAYGGNHKDWEATLEKTIAKYDGPPGIAEASRFLLAAALIGQSFKSNYDTRPATLLLETAKRYGVNVAAIGRELAAAAKAKKKPTPKPKPAATTKKKSKAA